MRKWKYSLAAKSLLVVSIPMSAQLFMLWQHGQLLSRVQEISEADYHAREVIGRTNYLSSLLAIAELTHLVDLAKDNREDSSQTSQFLSENFNYCVQKIPDEIRGLSKKVADSSRQRELLQAALVTINEMLRDLNETKSIKQLSSADLQASINKWQKLSQLRSQFLRQENIRISVDRNTLPEVRRQQEQLIITLEILSVSAAILTLALFIKGVAAKLWTMTENTERFLRKEPLAEPMEGSDEVATLDQKFHAMVKTLDAVESRKQEYLLMLSHDMRSPLASALASAELLSKSNQTLSESQARAIFRIKHGLNSVLTLINDLLDIERLESGSMPLNLCLIETQPLLERAVETVRALADRKEIDLEVTDETAKIMADPEKVVQILVNLLANSIKFSPNGGRIKVRTQCVPTGCRFSVADNGRGIPTEKLETIFNRFSQAKESDVKVGSGLGLAICKALVDAHGGKIGVTSKDGAGTEFFFEIPCQQVNDIEVKKSGSVAKNA